METLSGTTSRYGGRIFEILMGLGVWFEILPYREFQAANFFHNF